MAQTLFDIYLTGRLATGLTAGDAAQRLAQLFRTTPEAAANLVTGKPQLIKRGVDQATGEKYRDALQRAGLEVNIRAQVVAAEQPPASTPPQTSNASPAANAGLTLAPAGVELLTIDERSPVVTAAIDTSHIKLAPQIFQPLGPDDSARARPAEIDAPDFSLAPVGDDLLQPEEKNHAPEIVPVTPDLTLAEAGALLESLPKAAVAPAPDIAGLSLAPADGVLVKPEELPAKPAAVKPDISHLRLSE
jgi:hypothetical protein